MRMHNPLRSEADAFRWVVVIGAGALAVIALTLLTRPAFGVVLAAALIGFGAGVAYRSARGSMPGSVEITRGRDGRHRILVVANDRTYLGHHVNGRLANPPGTASLGVVVAASAAAVPLMVVTGAGQ